MPHDGKRFVYMHKDKKEMIAFTGGVLYGLVTSHPKGDDDLLNVYCGDRLTGDGHADRTKVANRILFGLILNNTGDQDLITTLSTNFLGDGTAAVDYIKKSFDHGDDEDCLSDANDAYHILLYRKVPSTSITVDEFNTLYNEAEMHARSSPRRRARSPCRCGRPTWSTTCARSTPSTRTMYAT